MAKKLSNLEVVVPQESPSPRRRRAPASDAQPVSGAGSSVESPAQALVGTQVYSTEEQALEVLLENVVGHVADAPESQQDMREFLSMILDTDPVLKEEILQATTIRK